MQGSRPSSTVVRPRALTRSSLMSRAPLFATTEEHASRFVYLDVYCMTHMEDKSV